MDTTAADDDDAVTSSAESDDCDSVVSAIFNRPGRLVAGPAASVSPPTTPRPRPPDDGRPNVFTYDAVAPPSAASGTLASSVYVLIDQGTCMSADTRLMWYLKRLGTVLTVDRDLDAGSPDQCRIVSYVARGPDVGEKTPSDGDNKRDDDDNDGSDDDAFSMDSGTRVYFMTAVCNMVYCLDMSPSNCSVDIQRGHVMLDEMVVALKRTIKGFTKPFFVPGSTNVLFEPQVYVTVIVHTPFYTSLAQQVLLQGWLINYKNYKEFIRTVTTEMNRLENALAKTKIIGKIQCPDDDDDDNVNIDVGNNNNDNNTNGNENHATKCKRQDRKFSNNNNSLSSHTSSKSRRNSENNVKNVTPVANTSPDSGFINTLRYGMLALRLLPPSSISNLIVITDGMITLADIQVLDSVLNQLRCIGVSCSFLHVSSQFHPYSSHGFVPYSELMQLISTATCGFYLNSFPKTIPNKIVNDYHDKFIMWSFKRGVDEFSNNTANLSCTPTCVRSDEWTLRNANFYGNRQTQLVSKKQISTNFYANIDNIVCCRMREGFIIEDILFRDAGSITPVKNKINSGKLQLKFILPWTNHIYIEYDISMKWPCSVVSKSKPSQAQNTAVAQVSSNTPQPTKASESDDSSKIFFTITVKGPYEFLHDITCNRSKRSQLLTQLAPKYQFSLSSCRLSSVSVTGSSTTITRNDAIMPPDNSYGNNQRTVSSKYRQALITRFWSTMRSIVQSDMLIKHLETYSPSTGHLIKQEQNRQQNEGHDRQHLSILESQPSTPIQVDDSPSLSPNSINSSISPKVDPSVSTGISETKTGNVSTPGVPKRSPLRSGIPLFYHPPTSSHNPFAIKQSQVRLNDQQGYDQLHQQFADFWKPICMLDPETQWPKWFSTYRLGGGVIILKHDRPLPAWLHVANPINNRYQTLSCREATDALLALLKQWCSFILIDDHSYVKCLDECETQTGNISFCIAQVSLKSSTCCCVVLHLAFQSCVPVYVHHKIIDDLTNSIELLDSTTAIKPLASVDNDDELTSNHEENEEETQEETNETEIESFEKSSPPLRYLYILDKPLDKILIKYERIPSQFTTVIFPDGSQPYPAPAVTTSNTIKQKPKLSFGKRPVVSQEVVPTGIEQKTVTTTTTLSRYLYHRRWIWSSGYKRYLKYNSNASQMLQIQLARTLSVLTHVRLKEGFRFAHTSSGIINMVLKVDMIEGSPSCPSTPTSHCVIQYVLFPPNIPHKNRLKDQADALKKKSNEDERSSTSSVDELQLWEKRLQQERSTITSDTGDSNCCCSLDNTDDDYQIIMECWIEPQHGQVVPNKKLNVDYMTGLMYEQLADAIWQVDFDCISSLYTFDLMQDMCLNHDVSIGYPDYDIIDAEQNKSVVVDAGRIYKLPFTFSLLNVLPKSRHQSSLTYSLFTMIDDSDTDTNNDKDDNKLNSLLERSFYTRLRTINDRSFEVDGAHSTVDLNQPIAKVNDQDIGQCFIKRIDSTRLILTVAPSFWEKQRSIADSSEDGLQPLNRSRANTWHHTKRTDGLLCPQPLDNSKHYFRTLSVGSKPLKTTDMSWDELKLDRDLLTPDARDIESRCTTVGGYYVRDFPTNMSVEIYECSKDDVQNILMFDSYSFDQSINDISQNSVCSSNSSTIQSDGNQEENLFISSRKEIVPEEPVDTLLLDKYLQRIGTVYDQSFVTSVFHALHLGLKVHHMDIQRAIDRCQHRLVTFEITNYIKAVCDHFKENSDNSNVCPIDDSTLKFHHNLIRKTFSSILNRHMLKTVENYPDFFFYDFIEKFVADNDSNECYYTSQSPTVDNGQTQYLPNILVGNPALTNFDSNEVNEEDLFPLFVQLKCTVKTNKMTKSQVVHSLPTCMVELMHQDNENETTKIMNLSNLKVTLDVYCFVLPNYVYDGYGYDDDDDDYETFNKTISLEELHYPINSNSITSMKQIECYEKPFIYLSAVLPTHHAQGLAAFIAEVEWCMRDEMAAGLLKDPNVTPDTLAKVIDHVSSSPCSSANEHKQSILHFVPSLHPSKHTSPDLFIQKLNQMDIMLDIGNDNVDKLYSLEKSTSSLFYVVKKDVPLGSNSENETSEPCLVKPRLPKFWIILNVQEDKKCQNDNNFSQNSSNVNTLVVNIFFHCRFTELDVGGRYSAVRESVIQNVQQTATIVNQTVLLSRLHDTRICDPLLEPIIEGHNYSDDDIKDNEKMEKNIKYFTKGQFKCPVVWSTTFSLPPRIQQSSPLLIVGGVHILSAVLDKFSIRNRRNMFVYKESKSGFVFYLRFYKNSNSNQDYHTSNVVDTSLHYDSEDDDSISRCSSASTTHSVLPSNHFNVSRKHSEDLNYADGKLNQTPNKRSLKLWATDLRDVENLTCNVHGIAPVGTEIRVDLVEVLQNRLNDAALEVLTTLLHRNPSCRLFLDDVLFIQPAGGPVDFATQISLPIETKVTRCFARTLKRTAAKFSLLPPKFFKPYHRFNYSYDTLDTVKPIIRSYFLYNYPCGGFGGRQISGKRGLSCILYDIYSYEDNSVHNSYDYPVDPASFGKYVKTTFIEDNLQSSTDHSGYVKLFAWCRGRVNMESLKKKITSIVSYTLWDIYVEQFLNEEIIIIEEPKAYVNPLCINFLTKWIVFGARLGVPFAHYSNIECRLHINHVLREFKTHLTWFGGYKSDKHTLVSTRYFYVPSTKYCAATGVSSSNNVISDSLDPLQLNQKDGNSYNDLMFYEWQPPDDGSVICPPPAACVLIVVSVTYKNNAKQNSGQNKEICNGPSDSDTDNGFVGAQTEASTNDLEVKSPDSFNTLVKHNTVTNVKIHEVQQPVKQCNKVSKLIMVAISGESVHTMSYNCHKNENQLTDVNHLSHWLELRRLTVELSTYQSLGLVNSISGSEIYVLLSKIIKNNPEVLLDYDGYVAYIEDASSSDNHGGSNSSTNTSFVRSTTKLNDNGTDDKKKKPLPYSKDYHDKHLENLVNNYIEKVRRERHKKILYEMWINKEDSLSEEALKAFYSNSTLYHFCLTPLLFLTQWRNESHSTRDFLMDANKSRDIFSAPQPLWHKKLCARLTNDFARYLRTNPFFTDLQAVGVKDSLSMNNRKLSEKNYSGSSARYYKQSVTGTTGGILILETGVSQPFFYIKLSSVDKSMIGNQDENKSESSLALLNRVQVITQKMHLHSFTYDFHACILSERLNGLIQRQVLEKRSLSILMEHKNPALNSTSQLESDIVKNVIAGFFDGFLKYYTDPPLYSSCLILQGAVKRAKLLVTSIQLYEYILKNSALDCDNMAVIKICDNQSVNVDDGSFLFDNNFDYDSDYDENNSVSRNHTKPRKKVPSDFILVRHMTGSDIQQMEKSEMNSNDSNSGLKKDDLYANYQYEVSGLYDVTLVVTLSVKNLVLDCNGQISLPFYVLVTDRDILEKKEKPSPEAISKRIDPRFDHNNHLLVSTSLPSGFFGNVVSFRSSTHWESAKESYSYDEMTSSKVTVRTKSSPHNKLRDKKKNFIAFYQKKAAELVLLTVDSATKRCFSHLLWQKFNKFFDQPKGGPKTMTIRDVEDVINKSELYQPLGEYDATLSPLIEGLSADPLWFSALHKLIARQLLSSSSSYSKTMRYRIFKNNINSEHQYLVILPNKCCSIELNAFIIIDNGIDSDENIPPTANPLIHVVLKRNVIGPEQINRLIKLIGNVLIFYSWRSLPVGSHSHTSIMSRVKRFFKN